MVRVDEGGGYQAEPSENLDEGQSSPDRARVLDRSREVHELQVVQFPVHEGTRSAEGRSSGCAY